MRHICWFEDNYFVSAGCVFGIKNRCWPIFFVYFGNLVPPGTIKRSLSHRHVRNLAVNILQQARLNAGKRFKLKTNAIVITPIVSLLLVSGGSATAASLRDPLKQPFATNSIWNMPIGSNARYVPANLSPTPGNGNIWAGMPYLDEEKIVLKPTAPMTALNYSSAAWSGANRCSATGGLVMSVPIPTNYIVPNSTQNNSAVFLMPDNRTIVQSQPLARCTTGAPGTVLAKFANVDLYGMGITGAHGGSGLSAIGGTLRRGELRPGQATGPTHALKVNVYAKEAFYNCSVRTDCFRWPAVTADTNAVNYYGSANNNQTKAMKQGSLLAIPSWVSIASLNLETQPGKQLAWTLQNYGAYIVDDIGAPGFALNIEDGPDGSKAAEFKADWGFDMKQYVNSNNGWRRDMQKIVKALYVVDNNSPTTVGGGGVPRQPLAAPIAP